ncbi:gamma-glutamylcyclotransferase [Vibrio cholerae]|uniref:gamma-glutamylcyclotransferase family protein n=1 Tax=Vibrio TaxID=662 RepID=UPI000852047E|nr:MULTISPECIES: gamma-glutamylcyclotransferase family protein [Vibrio]EJL6332768.1 gamma-glutamylcyclotransferase [Vibrio cholerae]EJL6880650.1 gamma-glutamylcyclotransferase [Vibrio cholerae]ELF3150132.1 gamma-glutamylcyclotransferase [Vibrio cholerae]ELH5113723.1 gamma-glutamylcyclotransferase [Vibrio cholerae]ELL1566557.1 gamma-glutamylcyclotransferase [Vibrio cholerae]
MKYFAYGSNMSLTRLKKRVPSAERVGMFSLKKHDLAFHKSSKDGSGKCDAYFTGNLEDNIFGALFEIDENEKKSLDRAEGLGHGYDEKRVQVEDGRGSTFEAVTYVATNIDKSLVPYSWYLNHVVVGAQETGVPVSYLEKIKSVTASEDSNKERDKEQREMYS